MTRLFRRLGSTSRLRGWDPWKQKPFRRNNWSSVRLKQQSLGRCPKSNDTTGQNLEMDWPFAHDKRQREKKDMKIATYSESLRRFLVEEARQPRRIHLRPWSFTREPDFVSEEIIVVAHHECSPWLQRCLHDGELCKVALSSPTFAGSSRCWRGAGGQCEKMEQCKVGQMGNQYRGRINVCSKKTECRQRQEAWISRSDEGYLCLRLFRAESTRGLSPQLVLRRVNSFVVCSHWLATWTLTRGHLHWTSSYFISLHLHGCSSSLVAYPVSALAFTTNIFAFYIFKFFFFYIFTFLHFSTCPLLHLCTTCTSAFLSIHTFPFYFPFFPLYFPCISLIFSLIFPFFVPYISYISLNFMILFFFAIYFLKTDDVPLFFPIVPIYIYIFS